MNKAASAPELTGAGRAARSVVDFVGADGTCHGPINSPRSLKACYLEGLKPSELMPASEEDLVRTHKGERAALLAIRVAHREKKRRAKCALVAERRETLIEEETLRRERNVALGTSGAPGAAQTMEMMEASAKALQSQMMEMEVRAVEAMKARQKRDIERMVAGQREMMELQKKVQAGEEREAARKRAHAEHVAEMRATEYERRKELEAKQKKRTDEELLQRKVLHDKERERELKIEADEEAKRQRYAQRQMARDELYRQKMVIHHEKMAAALLEQEAIALQNMTKMERKAAHIAAIQAEKKAAKTREIEDARACAEKRIAAAQTKNREREAQKKAAYASKQDAAARRHAEKEIEVREHCAKQAEDRAAVLALRKERLARAKSEREERKQKIIERRTTKEQFYGTVRAQRLAELEERKLVSTLQEEDRVDSIARMYRLDDVQREIGLQQVNADVLRSDQLAAQRKQLVEMRKETAHDALMRKSRVKEMVEQMKITNNFDDLDRLLLLSDRKDAARSGRRPQSAPPGRGGNGDDE